MLLFQLHAGKKLMTLWNRHSHFVSTTVAMFYQQIATGYSFPKHFPSKGGVILTAHGYSWWNLYVFCAMEQGKCIFSGVTHMQPLWKH